MSGDNITNKTVVVLFMDMLSADTINSSVEKSPLMPTFNKIKKNSLYYSNFYSSGRNTLLSMTSFFTGRRAVADTLFYDGISNYNKEKTLSTMMKGYGYHTTGIVNCGSVSKFFDFDFGFDEYYNHVDILDLSSNFDLHYFKHYKKILSIGDSRYEYYYERYVEFLDKLFNDLLIFVNEKIDKAWYDYDSYDYVSLHDTILSEHNKYKSSKDDYILSLNNKEKFFKDVLCIDKHKKRRIGIYSFFISVIQFLIALLKHPIKYFIVRGITKISRKKETMSAMAMTDFAINKISNNLDKKSLTYIHLTEPHDRRVNSNGAQGIRGLFKEYSLLSKYLSDKFSFSVVSNYLEYRRYREYHNYSVSAMYADTCLKKLTDYLEDNADDFTLIITADHGHNWATKESFKYFDADTMFDKALSTVSYHVPFLIYSPEHKGNEITQYTSATSFLNILDNYLFSVPLKEKSDAEFVIKNERFVIFEHSEGGTIDYINKHYFISVLGVGMKLKCEIDIPCRTIVRSNFFCTRKNLDHEYYHSQIVDHVKSIVDRLYLNIKSIDK
jgi:hypothetical protein